jgi:uncharacterized OB-fold protein
MNGDQTARWPSLDHVRIATDRWTQPYWDAAAEHRLVVQRCGSCGRMRMPPSPFCPTCRSQECDWPEPTGQPTIYSFTIVATAVTERQAAHVPYVPALIEFADAPGVRIVSNIVDAVIASIHIGAPVRIVWQDGPNGFSAPRFRLCGDANE